jgi:hypothetical protein
VRGGALTVGEAAELEDAWTARGGVPGELPWLPYPLGEWLDLMTRVNAHITPQASTYLELGAGIGTKVALAQAMGFHATGIEICPEYCQQARLVGAAVQCLDVRSEAAELQFALADVVYMNHPLADRLGEIKLERCVQARLKPGAILVQVRSAWPPAGNPWLVLHQVREGDLAVRKNPG